MPGTGSLSRLWPYLYRYPRQLWGGLFLVVVSAALTSVVPWLLRTAIDQMDAGAPASQIAITAAEMVAFAVVGGALRYWMRELLNGLSRWVEYDLRNDLFAHLASLDAAYFGRSRIGDLMARLTNDLSAVRMAAGPAIMYLVNTAAGGVIALYFMLRIEPRLALLALLPMICLPIMTARLGTAIHARFESVQDHFGTLTTHAQENITGTRIVRAYLQERSEVDRFRGLNEEYLTRNMRLVRLWGTMNPLFSLLAGTGAAIVLGVGGTMAVRQTIGIGDFVAFGFYLAILTWPLIALGWVINLFQRGAASMARLTEILDAQPDITNPALPRTLPAAKGGRTLEFRGVGFHYPTRDDGAPRWVLRDVSFVIPAGAMLGVAGATGSGKSALLDLIPRLYDPQEGEILLDGVPIRELPLHTLRAEIGYAPQESLLFSDTIGANLRYGGASEAEALGAARAAQLEETIRALPAGLETMLGERGINLSGGQKQRTAIARALAGGPSVVLLDDALSAVDTQTEAAILRALRDALAGRTAVIASHRISALRDATLTIVLQEGRVVEAGLHAELLELGGRYWSLLQRQQLEAAIEDTGEALASAATKE